MSADGGTPNAPQQEATAAAVTSARPQQKPRRNFRRYLIMAAVLVFMQNLIQGREEKTLNKAGQYCLDNLINRLYTGK